MKSPVLVFLVALLPLINIATATTPSKFPLRGRDNGTDAIIRLNELTKQALSNIYDQLDADEAAATARGEVANCTRAKLIIRPEFGDMAKEDRKAYTTAVKCLQARPPQTPKNVSTGVRSRYDDFVANHALQTPFIHFSGLFFGWHRQFLWTYEQALINECNYTGPIPYWDWSKWAAAPQDSPIFNGDEYSMGGNGEYIPNRQALALYPPVAELGALPPIPLPPQLGGGCVTTGPFANMTITLGPISLPNSTVGPEGGFGYNPRCLTRDVGPWASSNFANYSDVLTVMELDNMLDFENTMQGAGPGGHLGPHGGGHFTIAGDPGGDLHMSPGDPAFYLHHGGIDRLWTLWQALDAPARQYALAGTNTIFNIPPSDNTTLDYVITMTHAPGPNVPVNVTMRDVMSTTKGNFCYVYA